MSTSAAPASPTTSRPAELLFSDFAAEHAGTRRVLERYPSGKGTWRPHDKSRTLSELASHVAAIPGRGALILETEELDATTRPAPTLVDSAQELLAMFDANVQRLDRALAATTFDALERHWTMRAGNRVLIDAPRRELMRRMMMSHLVHHRAQLGVYYRLLGIAVPGVYGPSADD